MAHSSEQAGWMKSVSLSPLVSLAAPVSRLITQDFGGLGEITQGTGGETNAQQFGGEGPS